MPTCEICDAEVEDISYHMPDVHHLVIVQHTPTALYYAAVATAAEIKAHEEARDEEARAPDADLPSLEDTDPHEA